MTYEERKQKGYIIIKDQWRVKKKYNSLPKNVQPIPDYPTYFATPEGEIWRDTLCDSHKRDTRGAIRRITKLKDRYNPVNRYYQVQPYKNGKKGCTYTHRLVLAAFKGWPLEGYECNHIDRDTSNNHISNLEWIPKEENLALIVPNPFKGKRGPNKKESNSKWKHIKPDILRLRKEGKKAREIALKLDIPIQAVYICRR